jgi:hypothetical protein
MYSCKYPIRRIEVRVDTVRRGNMNYVQDNMFLGQLPKRLMIGCVDSDALNGLLRKTLLSASAIRANTSRLRRNLIFRLT